MKRYHPILVVIHWVMLFLIVMAWTSGQFVLEHTPNSDPEKIDALRMHMTVGLIVGELLILRLITKLRSKQPPHAKTGSALLDKAGVWAHWAFYVVIILIVASGMGTALFTGLIEIVFQGSGAALPENFDDVPPLGAHEFGGRNPIPFGYWACGCRTLSSILAKGWAIFTHVVWQTVLKLQWSPQNAG